VSLSVANSVDNNEWHLPTYDLRNENKYHYKLHSLDIYFWTQNDALQFVNGVRRVLPSAQVEILDEPGRPASTNMSPVVQNLEKVAISDSHSGTATSLRSVSPEAQSVAGSASSLNVMVNPPPPPPPPPTSFAPMTYNPAAPAAPETIMHREKTPPPDEDPLNPLAVAVAHDYQKQPFTPGYPPQSQFPLGVTSPGLPPNTIGNHNSTSHFAGAPTQLGIQRAASMPSNAALASSHFPSSPNFVPPPPPPPQPTTQSSANSAIAPVGGFANYTYSRQNNTLQGGQNYSLHQQLYRPTENEFGTNISHQYQPKTEPRGRLEENAGRLERGVSGMFKKFEKKFG
jgi:hypothetical protein